MRSLRRLALAALLALPAIAGAQAPEPRRDPLQHFFTSTFGDLKVEAVEARAAGKQGLLVMYTRDDCSYCERMKREVLSRESVQDYYQREFVALAVDTRGAIPLVDFAGKPTTEKAFAAAQGVKLTPTVVFYDFDGKPVARRNGEIRDAAEFLLLGRFVASGAYRTQSFADYKQGNKKGS